MSECCTTDAIFVFGSNTAGIHLGGAARHAVEKHGALFGKGEGINPAVFLVDNDNNLPEGETMRHSYALPTCDPTFKPLPMDEVKEHVRGFLMYAESHPHLKFFVTKVGCGIAGFTEEQIRPLFKDAPKNCIMPKEWT